MKALIITALIFSTLVTVQTADAKFGGGGGMMRSGFGGAMPTPPGGFGPGMTTGGMGMGHHHHSCYGFYCGGQGHHMKNFKPGAKCYTKYGVGGPIVAGTRTDTGFCESN